MQESVCSHHSSLREVLVAIDQAPAGIAFVTNDKGALCGVLTDGDVRRMLLKGRSLEDPLVPSDLQSYVFARQGESMQELMKRTDKRVRIIPIVDEQGKPVDYFRYEHKTHFTPVAEPSIKGKELEYVTDAILSTWISSSGAYIDRFEKEFSAYCGTPYGVAVSNGTVALHLALLALGIGPGDEVIVPDLTFAATINAVLHAGATPVIVDVDATTWCIDPAKIEAAITTATKAVIPVHVYGQICDMETIMQLAKKHDLKVIEDAAEAHGAVLNGKKAGSYGDIATFSFYGNKIITTGEGGMCLTHDTHLNDRMRVLRDHGMNKQKRYWHDEVGYNYRMTNIQAAIGCAQLERIDEILQTRRSIEMAYRKALHGVQDLQWQADVPGRERVVWLVSALYQKDRDALSEKLRASGIDVRPFFFPLSAMPVYQSYVKAPCPVSAQLSKQGINLPTVEGIDVDKVAQVVKQL